MPSGGPRTSSREIWDDIYDRAPQDLSQARELVCAGASLALLPGPHSRLLDPNRVSDLASRELDADAQLLESRTILHETDVIPHASHVEEF